LHGWRSSLNIGNLMLFVLNLPLAPIRVCLLVILRPLLGGGIVVFAVLGAHAANNSYQLVARRR